MPKNNKGERNKRGSETRMKREYVKPVIESEEFVANEYVAACYKIVCEEGEWDYIQLEKDPVYDSYDYGGDGFGATAITQKNFYTGSINGKNGESWILWNSQEGKLGRYVHYISSVTNVTGTDDPHPNASV